MAPAWGRGSRPAVQGNVTGACPAASETRGRPLGGERVGQHVVSAASAQRPPLVPWPPLPERKPCWVRGHRVQRRSLC